MLALLLITELRYKHQSVAYYSQKNSNKYAKIDTIPIKIPANIAQFVFMNFKEVKRRNM